MFNGRAGGEIDRASIKFLIFIVLLKYTNCINSLNDLYYQRNV